MSEAQDLVLDRLQREEARPGTVEFFESHFGWWIRQLGEDAILGEITRHQVQELVDNMRKQAAPTTIRHRLAVLGRACSVCGIKPNPANKKELALPRNKHRDPSKRLSWAEVIEILKAVGDAGAGTEVALLGFVAGTGIRRTEFARMRRKDLDVKGKRFVIPVGKTAPRELPMPPTTGAQTVVEELLTLNPRGKYLLPGDSERQRIQFLTKCIQTARAIMGDDDRRIQLHELRRCFGSRIAESYPVPVTSELLDHKLEGVVGRYVQADRKTLMEAMTSVWMDFEEE